MSTNTLGDVALHDSDSVAEQPTSRLVDGRASRFPGLLLAFVLVFNTALFLWIIDRPAGKSVTVTVDNVAQVLGPLIELLIGTWYLLQRRDVTGKRPRVSWPALFLAFGVGTDTIGQAVWTYYAQVLHQSLPFPSWADAAYLTTYPLLLVGILLLARGRSLTTFGLRVTLDGLIVMAGATTFSWYFVLGPTVLQGAESTFAKVVGTAYPLGDLLLIACVLILGLEAADRELRPVLVYLALGLGSIVIADSIFDAQTLQGTYATGEIIDVGWPLGDMLLCVAAISLGMRRVVPVLETKRELSPTWVALLPYTVVPPVGGLLLYTVHTSGENTLTWGVIVGAVVLVTLVLLRQILAILDTDRLSGEVRQQNDALREMNQQLTALVTTDHLTGLPNHRALVSALDGELERARRYRRPCSVLFVDLDHFKALNDTLGHGTGDAALRELGDIVRHRLRRIDTVGRWGGEEFLVVLPELARDEAVIVAERLRESVATHTFAACGGGRLTCSLGVATYPQHAEDRDALVALADGAMYAAKSLGRNQARAADDAAVGVLASQSLEIGTREAIAVRGTADALVSLVDARDSYTGIHTANVGRLSVALARTLGLGASDILCIDLAARLHDIGKVAIPDNILNKPDSLEPDEWVLMRTHPGVGADVVGHVPALRVLAPAIRAHHERWNGGGYPDGLRGENIPLWARVIAVADAYSAMTTDRPYRARLDPVQAAAEVRRCAGTQFDPDVVRALEFGLNQLDDPREQYQLVV